MQRACWLCRAASTTNPTIQVSSALGGPIRDHRLGVYSCGPFHDIDNSLPFSSCANVSNSALITMTARKSLNSTKAYLFRNSHMAIYPQETSSSINMEKYYLSSTGIVQVGGQRIGNMRIPCLSLWNTTRIDLGAQAGN